MTDEIQQITIATRSINDEERLAAEEAATEAVARVRARERARHCPGCGADVRRAFEGGVVAQPSLPSVLLEPEPLIPREQAARAWLVADDGADVPTAFTVGGDVDVVLGHRCPAPAEPTP